MSQVIHVTDSDFEEKVIKNEKPVLVDFWAEWCAPCKAIGPQLEELSTQKDDLTIAKVDVDTNKEYATKFGIRGIPTLIYFKNGEEVNRFVGADINKIKQMLD